MLIEGPACPPYHPLSEVTSSFCRMKKSKSKSNVKNNNRSFVGNLKKSFSQAYSAMEDDIDRDPLVVSGSSSRYFSEEDLLEVSAPLTVLSCHHSLFRSHCIDPWPDGHRFCASCHTATIDTFRHR